MSVLLGQRSTRRAAACSTIAAVVLASTGTAYALWPANGAGSASAAARELPVPTVAATCDATDTGIVLSWTSETVPVVASFVVARTSDGGTSWATIASPVAAAGTTTYSYSDPALAEGTYRYRVTALNNGWVGTGGLSVSRTLVAATKGGPKGSRTPASCA